MATSSTISMLLKDNTANTIYCHWDGYIDGVGNTLLENYTSDRDVHDLILQGDISSLRDTIEDSDFFRHHGETDVDGLPTELDEVADLQEYNYLWAEGEWLVAIGGGPWYKLAYLIEAEVGDIYKYINNKRKEAA